ncbi:MAG TPA: DUF4388 domain-containing protein [Thermomicrobiales bacterium]|nr:DUF4388 domain-containing protein [Thermomicrobiales bacterium]
MATIGELTDFSVADLMTVISQRRRTGRLMIKTGGNEAGLFFEDGLLVRVASGDIALRIGRMLIRQNLIDTPRLLEALHMQAESGEDTPIGEVLLRKGWITQADLHRCLEEQSIEVLTRAMSSHAGVFTFDAGVRVSRSGDFPPMEPIGLLKIAVERTSAISVLKERLPSTVTPFFLNVSPAMVVDLQLTLEPAEGIALGILRNGPLTFPELANMTALDELTLGAAILTLLENEYIATASQLLPSPRPQTPAARAS